LAASGQATILHVKPAGFDGPGSPQLILARPGMTRSELLDDLEDDNHATRVHLRFEPMVMAQDLATSVELLSAAIEAIPADRLNPLEAEQVVHRSTHPSKG
jgi:hypothetical protein